MLRNVYTIGNHSLDISNVNLLSKDLSQRFQANIEIGYCIPYYNYDNTINKNNFDEVVITDKIEIKNAIRSIRILDEFHFYREAWNQFKDKAPEQPLFKKYQEELENLHAFKIGAPWYRLDLYNFGGEKLFKPKNKMYYDDEFNNRYDTLAYIYGDALHDHFNLYDDWKRFAAFYIENYYDKEIEGRWNAKSFISLFGGTEAIYFDDENYAFIYCSKLFSFDQIKNSIFGKFKSRCLNLKDFRIEVIKAFKTNWKDYPSVVYDEWLLYQVDPYGVIKSKHYDYRKYENRPHIIYDDLTFFLDKN